MQCEVCGREIVGRQYKVIIEGAKMITCGECSKLGSEFWEPQVQNRNIKYPIKKSAKPSVNVNVSLKRGGASIAVLPEVEVAEGFGLIVRQARERIGLTPKDLGKKIGEKESVIKKIEGEKIVPDMRLASKLEHALKIELRIKPTEPKKTTPPSKPNVVVTLGEIVHLKRDKRRSTEYEGNNSLP